ncbi:MAG: hypothetical protein HKN62_16210 [Phycisphaerales bacterium]|nr:hypothetical protein [Phycisphaerales bacterium]
MRTIPTIAAALALSLAAAMPTHGEVMDITVRGTVSFTDLSRGPFADARVGDPVELSWGFDPDFVFGVPPFHIYDAVAFEMSVGEAQMVAEFGLPTFLFVAFSSFHGFENTSTGLLVPGGGVEHQYRIPVFGASGAPTFWLPTGSAPEDHIGCFPVSLFDTLNDNRLVDSDAGGPGVSQFMNIAMTSITIGGGIDPTCPGDLDGDQIVGFTDLLTLLAQWGPCHGCCGADLDGDDLVGFTDLLSILALWGACK